MCGVSNSNGHESRWTRTQKEGSGERERERDRPTSTNQQLSKDNFLKKRNRSRVSRMFLTPRQTFALTENLPSSWGYNCATLFLENTYTGTWPSRLDEFQIWESKIWSWVTEKGEFPPLEAVTRGLVKTKQTEKLIACHGESQTVLVDELLLLLVVASYKHPINPVINPYSVIIHS
jgi:hypothetical protein